MSSTSDLYRRVGAANGYTAPFPYQSARKLSLPAVLPISGSEYASLSLFATATRYIYVSDATHHTSQSQAVWPHAGSHHQHKEA